MRSKFVVSVALFGFACTASAEFTCDVPKVPDGAMMEMIAPDMTMNGIPTTIRAVHSSKSVADLITYYRNLWAPLANDKRPGSLEQSLNEWSLISTIQGDCFTTVQARMSGKGSYAIVSVIEMQKLNKAKAKVESFPALPGSQVQNDFTYADGVRNARTLVITNSSDLAANVSFYKNEFSSRGWTTQIERQPESPSVKSHVFLLKRGFEEANVVISQINGQVQIVANLVDRP
jgi:hypothetical protein